MLNRDKIRIVEDFPKKGIHFIDITTLLNDATTFHKVFDVLLDQAKSVNPDVIVAMEARGFIFAPSIALALNIPFVPIRKKGKLPYKTYSESYELEYGTAEIEIHQDAIEKNKKVLIFDDILASGGTAAAAIKLVNNFTPQFVNLLFLMEIPELQGREKLSGYDIQIAIN